MHFLYSAGLLLLCGIQLVTAQFFQFQNMFGQQQQQHHQQQQESGISHWEAHSNSVSCSEYLCPETLSCVPKPGDCPCPNPEDIKCVIPDGEDPEDSTVICTRGEHECMKVQKLTRKL